MVRSLAALPLLVVAGCFTEAAPVGTDGGETSGSSGANETGTTPPTLSSTTGPDSGTSVGPTQTTTTGRETTGVSTTETDTSSSDADSTSTGGDTSTGGGREVCPSFADEFDDDLLNPFWFASDPVYTSVEESEVRFELTPAPDDVFTRLTVTPPAGFEGGTMRIELGETPVDDGVFLMLWIEQVRGTGRVAFQLVQLDGALRLQARFTSEEGPPGQVFAFEEWDPLTQRWLQLREDDGTFFFETSEEGDVFSPLFEVPSAVGVDDVRVGFAGNNNEPLAATTEVSVRTFELLCAP